MSGTDSPETPPRPLAAPALPDLASEETRAGEGALAALGLAGASFARVPAVLARDRSFAGGARVGRVGAPPAGAARRPGSIFGRDLCVFSAVLRPVVGRGLVLVLADDGSAVAGHRPDRGFSLRVHRHLRVLVVAAAADVVRERRLSGRVSLARTDASQVLLAQPPRGSRPPRLVREPEKAEPHAAVRLEQRLRRARAVVAGTRAATVAKEDAARDFAPAPLSQGTAPSPAVSLRFPSGGGGRGLAAVALGVALTAQFRAALGPRHAGHPSLRVHAAASPAVGRPSSSRPVLSTFSQVGAGEKFGPVSRQKIARASSRFTFGAREARWRKLARPRTFWSAGADSRYDVPTRARGIARSVRLRGRAATRGADLTFIVRFVGRSSRIV